MTDALLSGIFAQSDLGCLTILRDEPVEAYVSISFTPNTETTVADVDAQMICVHVTLFEKALELAGYVASPKGRPRRA